MSKSNPRDTMLEAVVLMIIRSHVGAGYAISRADLLEGLISRGYHLDDRRMRKTIEALRIHVAEGAWICSTKNGTGYFYAENETEMMDFLHSESNRGWSIILRVKRQAKRAVPKLAGQLDIQPDQEDDDAEMGSKPNQVSRTPRAVRADRGPWLPGLCEGG